ncbi:MAG TPA: hypothetical protein VEI57_13220 [Nitrospirota bacterium]|nr:hypothetical protein [Nitrospirota bacterium]
MKVIIRIALVIILVSIGFAAGFPIGRSIGFTTGSEWAFIQASLIARERGLFMPVKFVEGRFRIVQKQPRNLYQRTRELAEKNVVDVANECSSGKELVKNISMIRGTNLTQ